MHEFLALLLLFGICLYQGATLTMGKVDYPGFISLKCSLFYLLCLIE